MAAQETLGEIADLLLEGEMASESALDRHRVAPALSESADEDRLVDRFPTVERLSIGRLVEGQMLPFVDRVTGAEGVESLDVQVEYLVELNYVPELLDRRFSTRQFGNVDDGGEAEQLVSKATSVGETAGEAHVPRNVHRKTGHRRCRRRRRRRPPGRRRPTTNTSG